MKSLKKTKNQDRSIRKKKSLVRIPITTKGGLFGYHIDMPLKQRRSLLKNILRKDLATYSEVVKRLNVLSIYNKNRHPEISKRVIRDMRYIQKSTKRKSTKRRSMLIGGKRRSSSGCSGL